MAKRKRKKYRPKPLPPRGTVAVYLRVSTTDQTSAMQRHAAERYLEDNPAYRENVRYYCDEGLSGASSNRPAFKDLIHHCEHGRVRAVIVYKLDRLTRDAVTGIGTLLRFDQLGVEFVSLTQPLFSHGTPFRHAMIAIFSELAQMEREAIVERVRSGLQAAKKRGVTLGRPDRISTEMKNKIIQSRKRKTTYRRIAEEFNVSLGAVHRICKAQGAV